jgi:hypothetical protein
MKYSNWRRGDIGQIWGRYRADMGADDTKLHQTTTK